MSQLNRRPTSKSLFAILDAVKESSGEGSDTHDGEGSKSPTVSRTTSGGLFASLSPSASIEGSSESPKSAPAKPADKVASKPASATVTPNPVQQKASKLTGDNAKFGHLKVLYAEDNLVNQKVLSRVLNRAGITDVTVVDNGKKAVDLTATTSFDCIFMDTQMPVMGGMEACQLILERDPSEVVVFVTAHALHEFKAEAEAVGATDFISKPFRLEDIKKVFKTLNLARND